MKKGLVKRDRRKELVKRGAAIGTRLWIGCLFMGDDFENYKAYAGAEDEPYIQIADRRAEGRALSMVIYSGRECGNVSNACLICSLKYTDVADKITHVIFTKSDTLLGFLMVTVVRNHRPSMPWREMTLRIKNKSGQVIEVNNHGG